MLVLYRLGIAREGLLKYQFDDGGRADAGFKGRTGDCVVRAVTIAANLPYREVYDEISRMQRAQRISKGTLKGSRSVRNGTYTKRKWFKDYMASLGFVFVPTMAIGEGCKVHLRSEELPAGRIIVSLSRHYAAVIDGVIHDTHDCSRDGERCVYGYWTKTK